MTDIKYKVIDEHTLALTNKYKTFRVRTFTEEEIKEIDKIKEKLDIEDYIQHN